MNITTTAEPKEHKELVSTNARHMCRYGKTCEGQQKTPLKKPMLR